MSKTRTCSAASRTTLTSWCWRKRTKSQRTRNSFGWTGTRAPLRKSDSLIPLTSANRIKKPICERRRLGQWIWERIWTSKQITWLWWRPSKILNSCYRRTMSSSFPYLKPTSMEKASNKTRSNPTLIDKIHAHRRYWVIINSICFKIKKWIKHKLHRWRRRHIITTISQVTLFKSKWTRNSATSPPTSNCSFWNTTDSNRWILRAPMKKIRLKR